MSKRCVGCPEGPEERLECVVVSDVLLEDPERKNELNYYMINLVIVLGCALHYYCFLPALLAQLIQNTTATHTITYTNHLPDG